MSYELQYSMSVFSFYRRCSVSSIAVSFGIKKVTEVLSPLLTYSRTSNYCLQQIVFIHSEVSTNPLILITSIVTTTMHKIGYSNTSFPMLLVDLNASAISHLLRGNRPEALMRLQEALNGARSSLTPGREEVGSRDSSTSNKRESAVGRKAAPPSHFQQHSGDHGSCPSQTSLSTEEELLIQSIPLHSGAETSQAGDSTSPFHLYDCAFNLSNAVASKPEYQLDASAALIFNMALIYHQVGVLSGNSKHLAKALNLYEMGLLLFDSPNPLTAASDVSSASATTQAPSPPGIEILQMALYNNMAHVHRQFMNTDKAAYYEGLLRQTLISVQLREEDERRRRHRTTMQQQMVVPQRGSDIVFFSVNVFFSQGRRGCAPAA